MNNKFKLVIADDEKIVREGLAQTIPWEEMDIEVVGLASNGIIALELILETRPHFLLTDIRMPGMNGIELTKKAKELIPDICIIMLTSFEDFSYVRDSLNNGAFAYLLKIEVFNELPSIINNAKEYIAKTTSSERIETLNKVHLLREHFGKLFVMGTDYIPIETSELTLSWDYYSTVIIFNLKNYFSLKTTGNVSFISAIPHNLDTVIASFSNIENQLMVPIIINEIEFAVIFLMQENNQKSLNIIESLTDKINCIIGAELICGLSGTHKGWNIQGN